MIRLSIILAVLLLAPAAWADAFRASVVKVDITPDRPQYMRGYGARVSSGVHMPIHHRVLALDDGKRKMIIASTEVCLISPTEYDRVAAEIQKIHGVPPIDFLWTATHTHSAPELGPPSMGGVYMPQRHTYQYDGDYTRETTRKLVDAVGQALSQLEPARLGIGWGASEANVNRRERRENGKIHLGKNPDGATDRKIGVLKIVKKDSEDLIATLANYAIHGTVLGGKNLLISGDAPGVVSAHVEEKTGAPMLFINGAAGNIAPIYSVFPTPEEGRLDEFKTLLGDRILEAQRGITAYRDAPALHPAEIVFESPRKAGLDWPADLAAYSRATAGGNPLVRMPCRSLKIDDDILIWSAPIELFCEISNEVRETSPFPFTFYFGYTNGWIGYLPTEKAFDEGGYEPQVTPFTPAAGRAFTDAITGHLKQRFQKP